MECLSKLHISEREEALTTGGIRAIRTLCQHELRAALVDYTDAQLDAARDILREVNVACNTVNRLAFLRYDKGCVIDAWGAHNDCIDYLCTTAAPSFSEIKIRLRHTGGKGWVKLNSHGDSTGRIDGLGEWRSLCVNHNLAIARHAIRTAIDIALARRGVAALASIVDQICDSREVK